MVGGKIDKAGLGRYNTVKKGPQGVGMMMMMMMMGVGTIADKK